MKNLPDLLRPIAALGVIVALMFGVSTGSEVTLPHTFVNGEVADADHFNANFTAIKTSVDDNFSLVTTAKAKTDTNGDDIALNLAAISGNTGSISTLQNDVANNKTQIETHVAASSTPQKVLTASTDINQLVSGSVAVAFSSSGKIRDGPFVIDYVMNSLGAGTWTLYIVPSGQTCTTGNQTQLVFSSPGNYLLYGIGYFVTSSQTLCASEDASGNTTIVWSGWIPYN